MASEPPTIDRPPRGARLRYAFDNAMARGPSAMLALLGLAIVVVVAIFSALLAVAGVGPDDPFALAYEIVLTVIGGDAANDPGATAAVAFLVVTVVGLLIFGAFIGSLVTGMDARLERLRQGRSLVLERDHTLVLGWSERVFTIVAELVIANESRERPSVVILADQPKSEMEDAIRERVAHRRNTRIVCRTGNPIAGADLALVNHRDARSVIVLGRDSSDDSDAEVIKILLALTRSADSPRGGTRHIVAEIQDASSAQAVDAHRRRLDRARQQAGDDRPADRADVAPVGRRRGVPRHPRLRGLRDLHARRRRAHRAHRARRRARLPRLHGDRPGARGR